MDDVLNNKNTDELLATIAANDSHHDFHHKISDVIASYQKGVKGEIIRENLDKSESSTMSYVIKKYDEGNQAIAVKDDSNLSFHSEEIIKKTSGEFDLTTTSGINYKVFKFRITDYQNYLGNRENDYDEVKAFMKEKSAADSVFSDFNINGTLFVHDASSINIYERLFKKRSSENMNLFFAHCPEISNDPAPKATLDTVATYGTPGNVSYYSVIPSNKGDSIYNYILDKDGIYETSGGNTFNSTYQVKFTEFNIDKQNNFTTNVTFSDLNASGSKIFEHDYKVKSRSSDTDTTISSVTGNINKLRNKSASGGKLSDKEVFNLNTAYQMKRGGDQLQVCFAKKVQDRLFENKGLVEFKTVGLKTETTDLIKTKAITDVYLVTHDQIAAAYALFLGVNVIFTNTKPGTKTVVIYKSSKTIDKDMVENNKYERLNLYFEKDSYFDDGTNNTAFIANAKLYNVLFKSIKEQAQPGFLPDVVSVSLRDIATRLNAAVAGTIQIPQDIQYIQIPDINNILKTIIENKINYDKFLLEIIDNGIMRGKGKLNDCIETVKKSPKRGKEPFKKIFKLLHIFIHLINNYTLNIDLASFIEKTKRVILDDNINQIVDVINSVYYFNLYVDDMRSKNIPRLAYIYNKKLGGKTSEKKETITGFDDVFNSSDKEMIQLLNTRKKFNENDVANYVHSYFNINESKKIATSARIPDNASNYLFEIRTHIENILKLLTEFNTTIQQQGGDDIVDRYSSITTLFITGFLDNENNPEFSVVQSGGGNYKKMYGGEPDILTNALMEDTIILFEFLLNEYNSENNYFYNFYTKNTTSIYSFIDIDINVNRLKKNLKSFLLSAVNDETLLSNNAELIKLTLINIFLCNSLSHTHDVDIFNNLYNVCLVINNSLDTRTLFNNIILENRYELTSGGENDFDIEKTDDAVLLYLGPENSYTLDTNFNMLFGQYITFFKGMVDNELAGFYQNIRDTYTNNLINYKESFDELNNENNIINNDELNQMIDVAMSKLELLTNNDIVMFINVCEKLSEYLRLFYDLLLNLNTFYSNYKKLMNVKKDTLLIYFNSLGDVKLIMDGLGLIEYMSMSFNDLSSIYDNYDVSIDDGTSVFKDYLQKFIIFCNSDITNKIYTSKGYEGEIEYGVLNKKNDTLKDDLQLLHNLYYENGYINMDKIYINKVLLTHLISKRQYLLKTYSDPRIRLFVFPLIYDIQGYVQLLDIDETNKNMLLANIYSFNFKEILNMFNTYNNTINIHFISSIVYGFIQNYTDIMNSLYINTVLYNQDTLVENLRFYLDVELLELVPQLNLESFRLYEKYNSDFFKNTNDVYCATQLAVESQGANLTAPLPLFEMDLPEYQKNITDDTKVYIAIELYKNLINYFNQFKNIEETFQACRYEPRQEYSQIVQPQLQAAYGGTQKKHTRRRIKQTNKKYINHNKIKKITRKNGNKKSIRLTRR
jgi:hypothetical protein